MHCLYQRTTCLRQTEELSQTQNWAPVNLAELLRGHRDWRWVRLHRLYARSICTLLDRPTGKPRPKDCCVYFRNGVSAWDEQRQERTREALLVQRGVLWKTEVIHKLKKGAVPLVGNNKSVIYGKLVHSWNFLQMKRRAHMDHHKTVGFHINAEKIKNQVSRGNFH